DPADDSGHLAYLSRTLAGAGAEIRAEVEGHAHETDIHALQALDLRGAHERGDLREARNDAGVDGLQGWRSFVHGVPLPACLTLRGSRPAGCVSTDIAAPHLSRAAWTDRQCKAAGRAERSTHRGCTRAGIPGRRLSGTCRSSGRTDYCPRRWT